MSVNIPVLLYHHVNDGPGATVTRPGVFRAHLNWLAEQGWRSMTLADFEAAVVAGAPVGSRRFLMTFDDGSPDLVHCASELRLFGFTGVAFLITGRVRAAVPLCIGAADVLALASGDTLEFQSHTHEHEHLDGSKESLKKLESSLLASRHWLEHDIGLHPDRVRHLAWPWGHCTAEMETLARKLGFDWQYLVQRGSVTRAATALRLPRLCADGMSLAQFARWMTLLSLRPGGQLANMVFGSIRHARHGMGYR